MKNITTIASSPVSVWSISDPQAIVVIAHGMMEHADRYAAFAAELNHSRMSVYAIHHIGHGANTEFPQGHWPEEGFKLATIRLRNLIEYIHQNNPLVPVFLFGHSMGSFISQLYMAQAPRVKGVILSGTNGPQVMTVLGSWIANIISLSTKATQPSPFLHHMAFDPYQKPFQPNRTTCDWLSRDNEQVDLYVHDPQCGFVCTVGFYKSFMKGLNQIHQHQTMMNIPKDLPVYLMSGAKDPVGGMGKGVAKLFHIYKKIGLHDVQMKLYPEGRHEMLNELNRSEVYRDIIDWILAHR